jgi:MFS family permease
MSHSKRSAAYAGFVIVLSTLFLFYKYVLQVSPSVMSTELMSAFSLNGEGLGNLAAMYFYAYLVAQLFAGPLLDRYNPKVLTSLAILVCACGAYLFAGATHLWVADVARALIGVGAAFATISYMKMAAIWFKPEQFAFVGGLLTVGVMLGAMLGQAPLSILVHLDGWRHSIDDLAWVGVVIAVLFFVCVKTKISTEQKAKIHFSLDKIMVMLKDTHNWWLTAYSGLAFAPLAVFGGLWGTSFIRAAYHLSPTGAASSCSMVFLGFGVGGPLFGYIATRFRCTTQPMFVGLVLSVLALSAVIYLPLSIVALNVLLVLFGMGTGAFMIGYAVGKDMNPIVLAASIIAMINTGDAILGALSEPLVGKFLDVQWHGQVLQGAHVFGVHAYRMAFLVFPIYIVLAGVCLMMCKRRVVQL